MVNFNITRKIKGGKSQTVVTNCFKIFEEGKRVVLKNYFYYHS